MRRLRVSKKQMLWISLIAFLTAFAGLNWLAWRHAHAMTHFTHGGPKTGSPESFGHWERIKVLVNGVQVPKLANTRTPSDVGLDYKVLRMPGAHGTSLEAWLIEAKQPAGVVAMFHGYSSSKDSLLDQAREIHRLGWTVLLVDFHGSGGSSGNVTSIGWHEAADVKAAFDTAHEIAAGKPVVLHGASMGAAAILRSVAALNVQPDGIIMECPFDRMLTTAENRFSAMGLPSFPAAQLLIFWGGRQFGFDGFANNPCDFARSVRCPALQMHGMHDSRVTAIQARRVFDAMAGKKQWVEFASAGHESYLASDPELWRESVRKFLSWLSAH